MPILISCSDCDWTASVPDHLRGKAVKCKACGSAVPVGKQAVVRAKSASIPKSPPRPGSPRGKRAKKKQPAKWVLPAVIGGLAIAGLAILLMVGISLFQQPDSLDRELFGETGDIREYEAPQALFDLSEVPVPRFPEEVSFTPMPGERGVLLSQFSLNVRDNPDLPGGAMTLRIYRPAGQLQAGSLPCVLVAPAGTPLIYGNALDAPDYHTETLPYTRAGMVTIMYSLDGPVPEGGTDKQIQTGYRQFRAAQAGLINARNALEFALAKLPEVNPRQIFCAGHSSAGTLSMLFAAHEPRLAGGLTYCGAMDVESRLGKSVNNGYMRRLLPGVKSFIQRTSPKTHVSRMKCPVFIFHARDDSNCPFEDSEKMAGLLQTEGKQVTFSPTDTGNHYQSMVEEGIPRGIEWIKAQLQAK